MSERGEAQLDGRSFERVLDAEKAADVRIAEAREEAEAILQAARGEARRIEARADRRLQLLHGDVNAAIKRDRTRLAQEFKAERRELATPPPEDTIRAAARRLARRLIGIDSS